MERIIRPVSRQLLRSHPRYPFSIPPPVYAKRLYTMGHTVPPVSDWAIDWRLHWLQLTNGMDLSTVERPVSLY